MTQLRLAATNQTTQGGFLLVAVAMALALIAVLGLISNRESIIATKRISSESEALQAAYVAEAAMAHATWVADQGTCVDYKLPVTPFGTHTYSALFSPTSGSPITISATGTLASGTTRTLLSADTTVFSAPVVISHQPDGAELDDTFGDAFKASWNHGAHQLLKVKSGSNPRHSLLRFNLDKIPTEAKMISAVLELSISTSNAVGAISAHRITNGWLEGTENGGTSGGATWANRDFGEKWVVAGGDYDATPVDTTTASENRQQWNITPLVDAWVKGSAINNGLILVPADATTIMEFHSSDSMTASKRPKLILSFVCECGKGGASGSTLLQPGVEGSDTELRFGGGDELLNYGAAKQLYVSGGGLRNSLLRFDLSSLPLGVSVNSATLELYLETANNSGIVNAHRVTQAWVEGNEIALAPPAGDGATYQAHDGQSNWLNPGGDYDPVALSSTTIVDANLGWQQWDVSGAAQNWLAGTSANDGILLRTSSTLLDNASFASSDSTEAARRPRLTIDFSCPCGVDCLTDDTGSNSCDADFAATGKEYHFDWEPGTADVTGIDFLPEGTVINGITMPVNGGWIKTDRNKNRIFVSDELGLPLTDFSISLPDPRGIAFVRSGAWINHIAIADKSDDAVYIMDLNGSIVSSFSTAGITTDPYGLSFISTTVSNIYNDHLVISSNKDGSGDTIGAVYVVDQAGALKKSIDVNSHAPRPQGVAHLNGQDKLMVADRDGIISIITFDGTILNQYDASAWGFAELQGVTIHPTRCEHVALDKKALSVAAFSVGGNVVTGGNANLLMVVTNPGNPTSQEIAKQTLFESWNYAVSLIEDSAQIEEFDAAVLLNDVVYVGEDIAAGKLSNKLVDAAIGVVNEEPALSDEFGLSSTIGWSSNSAIDVDDNSHYITLPFTPGSLDILSAPSDLADASGLLAADLRQLASVPSGPVLATLEFGGQMYDALPVAGRRVHLPWGGSNFDPGLLTANGETILRRSLEWGTQPPPRCDADFAANNLVADIPWTAGTADIHGIDYLPPGLVVNAVTIPAGGGLILSDKNKDRLFVTDLAGNWLSDFPMLAFDTQGVALINAGQWIHHFAVADKAADRVYYLDSVGEITSSFSTRGFTTNPLGLGFIGATASAIYDNHLAISSDKDQSGGGTAAVYIVDQSGVLKKTIDIESFAPAPQGVTHLTGSDKLLITDKNGMVSVIDFDGNLLHQYSGLAVGLGQLTDVAINPVTCEHLIVDKDLKKIAVLDPNAGDSGAGGPRYVEMYVPWSAVAPDTWESRNLGVFGVPSNAVVEVAIINADGGKELWGGAREMASTLERRLQLHEADGGGVDAMVLHVQTDSAGRIEHYSDDPAKLSFVLLGYWTESAYVESWDVFKAGASLGWQAHALNPYGVDPAGVAEILIVNNDEVFEHQAGLRKGGSALARIVTLHEAKDGGDEGTTLFSVADSDGGATVELYADDDASIDFYLLGHWTTPPGTFNNAFANLGTASVNAAWEDADLSAFGVPASAVAQIASINSEDGDEALLGLRPKGSAMSRWLELHQSKNGGDDIAAMHVNTDSSSMIQWYDEDVAKIHSFTLLGWWTLP